MLSCCSSIGKNVDIIAIARDVQGQKLLPNSRYFFGRNFNAHNFGTKQLVDCLGEKNPKVN
jgi:hypothetical protein